MLFGFIPNQGDTISAVKEFFASNQLKVSKEHSKTISGDCVNFMNRLFHKKKTKRLGYIGGITDLKYHPWFSDFNWLLLKSKELKAPFVPSSTKDNFNARLNKEGDDILQVTKEKKDLNSKNAIVTQYYRNFTFIGSSDANDEKDSEYKLQDSIANTSNHINEESESEKQQQSVNSSISSNEESESNDKQNSYNQFKSRNDKGREKSESDKEQNSSIVSDSQSEQSDYMKPKKRKHKTYNSTKKRFASSLNNNIKSLLLPSSDKVLTINYPQLSSYVPDVNKHKQFKKQRDSNSKHQTMFNIYEQNQRNIFRQKLNHFELDSPTDCNRYSCDIHKTSTSLPKILSPQRCSCLGSIKEETPVNIHCHKNSLSNSKFFNYNLDNHIKKQDSKTLSPFKYVADQIQNVHFNHKLNKHKTVRSNGHIFSSFDTTKNDSETNNNKYNQDQENSFAEPYSRILRQNSHQSGRTLLRPNRKKSFFDFTLGVN